MRELSIFEVEAVSGGDKIGAVGSCRQFPAKLEGILDAATTVAMIIDIWRR